MPTTTSNANGDRRSATFYVASRQVIHYFSADMTRHQIAAILAPHYANHFADPLTIDDAVERIVAMPDRELIALFDEINGYVDDLDPDHDGWENGGDNADVQGNQYQRLTAHPT